MYSTYGTEDNFYIPFAKVLICFWESDLERKYRKNYHLVLDSDIVPNK